MPVSLHPVHGSGVPLAPLPTEDSFYQDYTLTLYRWAVAELRNFDIDSDEVKYEHTLHFYRVIEAIKSYSTPAEILLQGLASHTGSWEHNLELMKRRAVAVGVQLNHFGIPASRFSNRSIATMSKNNWSHKGFLSTPDPGETGKKRAVRILFGIDPDNPPPYFPARTDFDGDDPPTRNVE
jgi:hypothetical protein